jgi:hypothetical protein
MEMECLEARNLQSAMLGTDFSATLIRAKKNAPAIQAVSAAKSAPTFQTRMWQGSETVAFLKIQGIEGD